MNIVTNESIILVDIDGTLIEDFEIQKITYDTPYGVEAMSVPITNNGYLELDYYGKQVYKKPITEHIDFVRSLKKRGYYVTVHSRLS